MSTVLTSQIDSSSSDATEKLGQQLGQNCRGSEVIELVSDLGGGKTTFVHGLAKGLGSHDAVTSPTFKISNVYTAGDMSLYHFDFYRLNEAGLIAHELQDAMQDPKAVVVVEWGEVVAHVLPKKRLTIQIAKKDITSRYFSFSYPEDLTYLLENVC